MFTNQSIANFFNNIIHRLARLADTAISNRQKLRQIDQKLNTILAALPKVQSFSDKITDDLK